MHRTGRPGHTLLSVLAVHAVKLYFQEKTMTVARDRLLSCSNLRTITGVAEVPSLSVISKKTDTLIDLVDFSLLIILQGQAGMPSIHRQHDIGGKRETGEG